MNTNIYSIYDRAADIFNVPFTAKTNLVALRQFSDLANDQNSAISKHPNDYSLHLVGHFDDEMGKTTGLNDADGNQTPPQLIGEAKDLTNDKQPLAETAIDAH